MPACMPLLQRVDLATQSSHGFIPSFELRFQLRYGAQATHALPLEHRAALAQSDLNSVARRIGKSALSVW